MQFLARFIPLATIFLPACATDHVPEKSDFVIGELRPKDCPNPTRSVSEGRVAFLVDAAQDGTPTNIRILETWPMGVWDNFAVCQLKKRKLGVNGDGQTPPFRDHRITFDIKIH